MSQADLAHVMRGMEDYFADARLIVGPENFADAGIVRFEPERALVQSLDFFPPVVDDPWHYGAIAAANALSDIYAMGGEPISALCIAGFPGGFDPEVVRAILRGGFDKLREAGAAIAGGHTVRSAEVWFGFSVTGEVNPGRVVRNDGARPGDRLWLTKPIGMGAVTTGIKRGLASAAAIEAAHAQLARLNREASRAMIAAGARAATDVTGFGLLGHASNVAAASGVTFVLDARRIPLATGAEELARAGCFSGGAERSRAYLEARVEVASEVESWLEKLCRDAETSGGLLLALPPQSGPAFAAAMATAGEEAWEIGWVEGASAVRVRLVGVGTPVEVAEPAVAAAPCLLYAEDEEVLREAGLDALRRAGFLAVGAPSGGEALRLFRADPDRYDLVVLDWNLPGLAGVALVRELRSIRGDVKILLASAEDAGSLPELEGVGEWLDALRKPFRSYELLSKVSALLARR